MTDEMKPVRCGCGGVAVIYVTHWWGKCYVCECEECGTASRPCTTETEAVTAWNRAMSGDGQECAENARCNERTVKVDWINGEPFCPMCGDRLEWE